MKAVTIVAAAGLAGSAAAGHVHMHEKLHKRDTTTAWTEWDPSTTTEAAAASTSSTETSWSDWSSTTTTTTSADPTSTETTWADWNSTTSADPTTTATSWADWNSTATSYSTATVSPVQTSASAWLTGSWADPSVCSVVYVTGDPTWGPDPTTTSTIYSTVTVQPTDAASSSWGDWDPSTTESAAASSSTSWADWTSTSDASWTAVAESTATVSAVPAASPTSSFTGKLGSYSGTTWAMTYSPYTSAGGCKDAGTVSSDIATIAGKGFTTVRVYSTDCSTLQNVGTAARANGLKLILGVFISSTGISGAEGQVWDIVDWAQWDLVELIVVGNEAVFNGYCTASALAGFVSSSKGSFATAGYTGPVTTTEPIDTWLNYGSELCGSVDVTAANLYAFFNAQTTADNAGSFIQAEIIELEGVCPSKDVYVMETGWPHAGNCNGVACPGVSEQATAINSIKEVVGAKVVFFSFEDDAWKQPGQFDVEQYWGCADVFAGN